MRKLATAAIEAPADALLDLEADIIKFAQHGADAKYAHRSVLGVNRDGLGKLTIEASPRELDVFHFAVADNAMRLAQRCCPMAKRSDFQCQGRVAQPDEKVSFRYDEVVAVAVTSIARPCIDFFIPGNNDSIDGDICRPNDLMDLARPLDHGRSRPRTFRSVCDKPGQLKPAE